MIQMPRVILKSCRRIFKFCSIVCIHLYICTHLILLTLTAGINPNPWATFLHQSLSSDTPHNMETDNPYFALHPLHRSLFGVFLLYFVDCQGVNRREQSNSLHNNQHRFFAIFFCYSATSKTRSLRCCHYYFFLDTHSFSYRLKVVKVWFQHRLTGRVSSMIRTTLILAISEHTNRNSYRPTLVF